MFPGRYYIVYLVKIAFVLFFGVCRSELLLAEEQAKAKVFPIGELFEPLIAAPKNLSSRQGFIVLTVVDNSASLQLLS